MSDAAAVARDTGAELTSTIVSAYVRNHTVPSSQLAELIGIVHRALSGLGKAKAPEAGRTEPAVPIRKSVTPDYLICLEDGKKLKMLKRHLRATYGMTPEEYRAKWRLPPDYPMVAPNYAQRRSEFAKSIGLGRKGAPARRGRRKPVRG